jgi:hypothetical protein
LYPVYILITTPLFRGNSGVDDIQAPVEVGYDS